MLPEVSVRYWAGARRAAGHDSERIAVATVGDLRAQLATRAELREVCAVASFLVDGQQAGDGTALRDGALVDVLPPFAGGSPPAEHADGAATVGLHVWVSGDVQGVGFRAWTRTTARRLGLTGWVTNVADGRVELAASGSRDACQQLLDALRGPSAPGAVDDVKAQWGQAHGGGNGFEAR